MTVKTICKTVHQYNRYSVLKEEMKKLQEIAEDYRKVKNDIYQRYGGKNSLSKIYPGYTVQKEMGLIGIRERMELPSVYFNVAVLDALGDIKSEWACVKALVSKRINRNKDFSEADRHYLRFVIKVNNVFEMVLNNRTVGLKPEIQKKYTELCQDVNVSKLDSYLKRQVRKFHKKLYIEKAEGFFIVERAYRYDDHGIYITVKEKRRRIFIPLTDSNTYDRQIYLKLYPKEQNIELLIPIKVKVRHHSNYDKHVGVALGMDTMLVTDSGNRYGEHFGEYQMRLTEWMWKQQGKYSLNRHVNPGRKKYLAKKGRLEQQLHSYINMELNHFLKEEKPKAIYLLKSSERYFQNGQGKYNYYVTLWQRGYIRKRIQQKCMEQSIRVVEIYEKDISDICSRCGAKGTRENGIFHCTHCKICIEEDLNIACNVKEHGTSVTKAW